MGVIQIRQRSESLGNIGAVRQVETDNGAARAFLGMAEAAREEGQAGRALAGGIADLANGARKLALDFAAMNERRAQEAADRYVARFQQGMDAYNDGTTDGNGGRVPGAMETDFADSGEWIDGNVEYRDRLGEKLKEELKMSPRAMEIARKRLLGYNLHMQNRWQARAAKVDDLKAQSAAGERLLAAHSALANTMVDGDTNQYGADYALALEEWKEATENVCERTHLPEEARPAARRKAAMQLCQDVLAARLRRCEDDALASETATPDSVKGAYADLEDAIREFGWEGVFPFGATARDAEGKPVSDPVRENLKGTDLEAFNLKIAVEVNSASARQLKLAG